MRQVRPFHHGASAFRATNNAIFARRRLRHAHAQPPGATAAHSARPPPSDDANHPLWPEIDQHLRPELRRHLRREIDHQLRPEHGLEAAAPPPSGHPHARLARSSSSELASEALGSAALPPLRRAAAAADAEAGRPAERASLISSESSSSSRDVSRSTSELSRSSADELTFDWDGLEGRDELPIGFGATEAGEGRERLLAFTWVRSDPPASARGPFGVRARRRPGSTAAARIPSTSPLEYQFAWIAPRSAADVRAAAAAQSAAATGGASDEPAVAHAAVLLLDQLASDAAELVTSAQHPAHDWDDHWSEQP